MIPTKDEILEAADKFGFVVPYNGSNNFYNDDRINGFIAGAEFVLKHLQEETVKDAPKYHYCKHGFLAGHYCPNCREVVAHPQ